jgi:hypothetical protein
VSEHVFWFRIFDAQGGEVGRTVLASDAALLASRNLPGATIKYGAQVVWVEGEEGFSGAEDIRAANQIWSTIQRKGR